MSTWSLQEIRDLDKKRVKTVGISFGHQAIAQALGGQVGRNPKVNFHLGLPRLKFRSVCALIAGSITFASSLCDFSCILEVPRCRVPRYLYETSGWRRPESRSSYLLWKSSASIIITMTPSWNCHLIFSTWHLTTSRSFSRLWVKLSSNSELNSSSFVCYGRWEPHAFCSDWSNRDLLLTPVYTLVFSSTNDSNFSRFVGKFQSLVCVC